MKVTHWESTSVFDRTPVDCKWFSARVKMRRRDGLMGRFGGGWNWKLGFQQGGNTLIVSLLVLELVLVIKKGKKA